MPHMVRMLYQHEAQGHVHIRHALCKIYSAYTRVSYMLENCIVSQHTLNSDMYVLLLCVILGWAEFTDDSISERTCGGG